MLKIGSQSYDAASPSSGWQIRVSHDRLIVLATLLVTASAFLLFERIPIGGGFGWDGKLYGNQAKNLLAELEENPLNEYYVHRVLPSAVIHLALRVCHLPLTNASVIAAFGVLNVLCSMAVSWFWCRIARAMGIGVRGKWLGFVFLILNFAVIKHSSYYPVLTDMPAYALGGGMFLFYLERRTAWLMAFAALGSVTWPTLFTQGLILLLLPRRLDEQCDDAFEPAVNGLFQKRNWNILLASLGAYYFLIASGWALTHAHLPICGYINPSSNFLLLSRGIAASYIFIVLFRLLDVSRDCQAIVRLLRSNYLYLAGVFAFAATIMCVTHLLVMRPGGTHESTYLLDLPIKAVSKPGIFLLGHIVYFGPAVLLATFLWQRVSRQINTAGAGIRVLLLLTLLNALDSESRHLIYVFPLLVPFVVQATEQLNWTRKQYVLLTVVSALLTKCWLTINNPPIVEGADMLAFPQQYYGMNHGCYMTNETYLLQGAAVMLFAAMIYLICIDQRAAAPGVKLVAWDFRSRLTPVLKKLRPRTPADAFETT